MIMIFLLFFIGSILIILNVRAIRKENNSFQFKLNNAGNDMGEFEVQMGALRKEFSETILELQIEIQNLNRDFNNYTSKINATEITEEISKEQIDMYDINKEEVTTNENETINKEENQKVKTTQNKKIKKTSQSKNENNTANSVKINEIEKLVDQELTTEEIAEKLGIGKGEVLLIKQLYIK
jgi:DNA-binding transcriptional regulator YiaG